MSDIAIKVEGLSKLYRIGRAQKRHDTLRDRIADARLFNFFKRRNGDLTSDLRPPTSGSDLRPPTSDLRSLTSDLWALKDVSFEVKRGEVVGIIGRNGAGKSTLLKVLSRITEPTKGAVDIYGRVGSLLEVGTGFHPELTGRENIYLNGSILGMKRSEIQSKFDEMVAFAEVEKFIDTPVKHYSSGMYVRLAFAVAAHLDPEILLVDEVLAVGDVAFQKKCLGKMEDIGEEGRTVLFVSHSMQAISRLCKRTVLLGDGNVVHDGPSHQVVSSYVGSGLGNIAGREWGDISQAPGDDVVRLCAVRIRAEDGRVTAAVDIRNPIDIEMEYEVLEPGHVLVPNFHIYNEEGICVCILAEFHTEWHRKLRPIGRYKSTARIPGNFMAEGSLSVGAAISTFLPFSEHLHERDAVAFQVVDSLDGNSARGDYAGHYPGVVRPLVSWATESGLT